MKSRSSKEIRLALIERAGEDEEFRARLLADPKSVIEGEFDVTVPEGYSLHVHEESPDTAHLVLPPGPGLSSEEMATVAAGYLPQNDTDSGQGADGW